MVPTKVLRWLREDGRRPHRVIAKDVDLSTSGCPSPPSIPEPFTNGTRPVLPLRLPGLCLQQRRRRQRPWPWIYEMRKDYLWIWSLTEQRCNFCWEFWKTPLKFFKEKTNRERHTHSYCSSLVSVVLGSITWFSFTENPPLIPSSTSTIKETQM